jgi:hypothetical protein
MTKRTRSAMSFVLLAFGLAACDDPRSPSAPSTVPPPRPKSPNQEPYTLTPSSNLVAPGGALSVSWTAPRGGTRDWIGLFSIGARDCDHGRPSQQGVRPREP